MNSQIAENLSHYINTINMEQRNTHFSSYKSYNSQEDRQTIKSIIKTLIESDSTSSNPTFQCKISAIHQKSSDLLQQIAKRLKIHFFQKTIDQLIVTRLKEGINQIVSKNKNLHVPLVMENRQSLYFSEDKNIGGNIKDDVKSQIKQLSNKNYESISQKQRSLNFPQNSFKIQKNIKKFQKELFMANLQNNNLKIKVKDLQTRLIEVVKRQQKQLSKKSDSLKGLIEQLSEKNQMIEELKASNKTLEGRLHALDKGILNIILQQDSELLKKVVFRLQHINDKLNTDVQIITRQKNVVQLKNRELINENEKLKQTIQSLTQQLFEIQIMKHTLENDKRQLSISNQRMNSRIEKIKKGGKRLNEISRYKDSLSTNIHEGNNSNSIKSQKKIHDNYGGYLFNRTQSMKEIDADNKLEAIFTYLFHIDDQSIQLQSPQLFDQDEKDLLAIHKQKFIRHFTNHYHINNKDNRNLQKSFDLSMNSLQIAFSEAQQQKAKLEEQIRIKTNRKLMSLELERTNMIEKISELKQKQLHLRSIIFSFLKSLQLKSLKRNTESICQILFDFFQYSQQQKNVIFQAKNKRFFGIL